ncbi:leucine-rich repeat-containing protein 43 [Sorex fumeus]|uniref:leucine-rich repeat-containing protein 43 n=1 Tax=Sorex fumeus TaxID=62283 RepID=UPI0024AE2FF6|nr:leucine-rich repeat-containing protein 43 [Sorex fumeus]
MERPGCTVSEAVQEHLQQLCLHDFPCGTGSWNRSRFLPRIGQRRPGPQEEPLHALLDLASSPLSPWALPEGASNEDRFLKELAIRKPRKIKDSFFYSYFTSLRMVDKKVSLVDKGLLRFLRLEELILSANQIQDLDSAHLPPTLRVLELYGNRLRSLECLCAHPPPRLQHLGAGHNQLLGPAESLFLTAEHWPSLVSLDLSFNNLTDLHAMTAALRTLRQLRLLLLLGNPLALVAHYRGFTIDSLAPLCVLDDLTVTASEKHQFRGLSREADLLENKAQITVTINSLRGVLDSSIWDPEPGPDGPFIAYNYYVTYDFVEDEESMKKEEFESVLAEIVRPPSMDHFSEEFGDDEEVEAGESLQDDEWVSQGTAMEESDMSRESSGNQSTVRTRNSEENELAKLRPLVDLRVVPSHGTVLFSTARKPYSDVITYSYQMQHNVKGLASLKTFLLSGTTITIVEEKILSWHLVSPPSSPMSLKRSKGDKKKEEKKEKGKGHRQSKTKVVSKELHQDAPILKVLGRAHISLEPLVAGDSTVSMVLNLGVIRTLESDRLTFMRALKMKSKKSRREKGKSTVTEFDENYRPEPLTVEVQIQLNQYRSAEEALRTVTSV